MILGLALRRHHQRQVGSVSPGVWGKRGPSGVEPALVLQEVEALNDTERQGWLQGVPTPRYGASV